MRPSQHLIGTAGWSVPRGDPRFPEHGSGLERYAAVFSAVEINSSFYRRHRPETWQRWNDAVPESFRFSVKLPQVITHDRRLIEAGEQLELFFTDVAPLGGKLGAVLIQLPPTLAFDAAGVERFLDGFRARTAVPAFIEPRHESWATVEVSEMLDRFGVGRAYADPQDASLQAAAGVEASGYLRLHGSPKVYYSAYGEAELERYANLIAGAEKPAWCIFDNTASGAAVGDALVLRELVGEMPTSRG